MYDLGLPVRVAVTGTLAGLAPTTTTSAPTANVVRATFTNSPTPTISGTPQFGLPLTAVTGTWDPGTALTYVWAANGVSVSAANGGTGPTFTPSVAAQLGQVITVTVTGTKAGHTTVSRTSGASAPVAAAAAMTLTPTPTVTGTPQVGLPLTAVPGQWDDGVALAYQWAANGTNIGGATGVSFTPTVAQLGATLTVTVTGSRGGFTSVVRPSAVYRGRSPGRAEPAADSDDHRDAQGCCPAHRSPRHVGHRHHARLPVDRGRQRHRGCDHVDVHALRR